MAGGGGGGGRTYLHCKWGNVGFRLGPMSNNQPCLYINKDYTNN